MTVEALMFQLFKQCISEFVHLLAPWLFLVFSLFQQIAAEVVVIIYALNKTWVLWLISRAFEGHCQKLSLTVQFLTLCLLKIQVSLYFCFFQINYLQASIFFLLWETIRHINECESLQRETSLCQHRTHLLDSLDSRSNLITSCVAGSSEESNGSRCLVTSKISIYLLSFSISIWIFLTWDIKCHNTFDFWAFNTR